MISRSSWFALISSLILVGAGGVACGSSADDSGDGDSLVGDGDSGDGDSETGDGDAAAGDGDATGDGDTSTGGTSGDGDAAGDGDASGGSLGSGGDPGTGGSLGTGGSASTGPCYDQDCQGNCSPVGDAPSCGGEWQCHQTFVCTDDLAAFCGCDGMTFQSSSSCVSRAYSHEGPCEN